MYLDGDETVEGNEKTNMAVVPRVKDDYYIVEHFKIEFANRS